MDVQAAPRVKLSSTNKTIKVGKVAKITLKNNNKKVKWSVSNNKIKIVKSTNKYVKVKGVKAGKAVLKAKVGKKTYKCKFVVKNLEASDFCGSYDMGDAEIAITYDGRYYNASMDVFRIASVDKLKGVQYGNKLFLAEYGEYTTGIIIEVGFNESGDLVIEVIESGFTYIQPGDVWKEWKIK